MKEDLDKIEERFDELFCSKTSIPKYSVWNAHALAYPTTIKSFYRQEIEKLLAEQEEIIRKKIREEQIKKISIVLEVPEELCKPGEIVQDL